MSTSPLKSPGGMAEPEMVQNNNAVIIEVQSPKAMHTESSETSMVSPSTGSKPTKMGSRINVVDEIDKPDYAAFKQKMNEVHARNKNFEPYTCGEACCEQTGWYCCFGTTKKSPIDQYGVAVVHYFRFLKYLAGFFFIASILSIPVLYFAVKMSADFGDSGISDYKTVLYYTTLGSFATGSSQCQNVLVGTLADGGGETSITFSCEVGTIGSFDTLSYGRVVETQSITCDYYTHFSWDDNCNEELLTDIKSEYASCEGEKSCEFIVKSSYFDYTKTGCLNFNPITGNSNNAFYFNILCQDIKVETVGGYEVSKKNIGYIVASFDAGIYLILILMLFLLKYSENAAVVNVLGNNEGVDSYTIEVRSLPSNLEMSVLKTKLWKHFSSFKANRQTHNLSVVDVQLAESDTLLTLNTELGILKAQKVKVYRKYYKKWSGGKSPSPTVHEVEFEDLQKLSHDKGKKAQKAFKPIEKMQKQQTKLQTKIDKLKSKKNSGVISAFITFESRTDRDIAYTSFQRSAFNRMCYACKCCCASKNDCNIFEGRYLRVTEATDPGNIKWENMSIKPFNRNARRLFSWVVTIGLWIVSFAFMVFVRNQQRDVSDQVQPTKDCSGYTGITKAQAEADMELGVNGQGLLECYCRAHASQAFSYPCTDWSLNRIFIAAIPFVIVFAIIIINFILQYVFKFLSSFEKHRSQSSESVSKILKIFVAQALNTGVIILIVNAKFSKIGVREVFEGTFDDVTSQWFFDVGVTILITMIINVINVPAIVLVFRIISGIRRWFDRGCTMRMNQTKQKKQGAWENLYIGPEFLIEFRYSQILTITFICLFYSAGIPFLFISSFVNIFFLYWLDKICLLRLYRLPKNLDKKLHSVVRQSIFIAILLHLGNAVWNYGNPQIFGGDSSSLALADKFFDKITDDTSTPGLFAKLIQRAIQYQDISLSVIFVALLLIIVAKIFFSSTINKLFKACRRGKKNLHNSKYAQNQSYFSKIKRNDLAIEKRYLEKELYNTHNDAVKQLLETRLVSIREEIQKRPPGEEKIGGKFPGIFSYFVGHNPDYKRYYLQAKGLKEATPTPH
jgi:hypothetical protein